MENVVNDARPAEQLSTDEPRRRFPPGSQRRLVSTATRRHEGRARARIWKNNSPPGGRDGYPLENDSARTHEYHGGDTDIRNSHLACDWESSATPLVV